MCVIKHAPMGIIHRGFTDRMLQNGAKKVFAIDVGRGQLDWKLRNDERVVCMEKTNIRYVLPEDIGEPVDFSSIDVSFISLTKVLTPIRDYLKPDGEIVALIKPQFEAGREKVGKKGVVRDKSTHLRSSGKSWTMPCPSVSTSAPLISHRSVIGREYRVSDPSEKCGNGQGEDRGLSRSLRWPGL